MWKYGYHLKRHQITTQQKDPIVTSAWQQKRKPLIWQTSCQFWIKHDKILCEKGSIRFSLVPFSTSTYTAKMSCCWCHLKREQKWAMLGTSGQACRSLSVDILPNPQVEVLNPHLTQVTQPDCLLSYSQLHLRWCLFGLHLVGSSFYNSCFHFLWLNDPHLSTQLPSCSGWTISRTRFTCDFVRISCDRNVLTGIVSVYPNPLANRLCSSSACVRQCASGSGAATGLPRFCFKKLKCQISSSVERDANLVLKQSELSTWDEIIGFHESWCCG